MLVVAVAADGEVLLIQQEDLLDQEAEAQVLQELHLLQMVVMEILIQVVVAEELAEEQQLILLEVETVVQVL
jgi:hypothetical protein